MGDANRRPTAILVDPRDNVATVAEEVGAGDGVWVCVADEWQQVEALNAVPFGHKIALTDVGEGDAIRKYGECIGAARCAISRGQHVHSHNLRSLRGQVDMLDRPQDEDGPR